MLCGCTDCLQLLQTAPVKRRVHDEIVQSMATVFSYLKEEAGVILYLTHHQVLSNTPTLAGALNLFLVKEPRQDIRGIYLYIHKMHYIYRHPSIHYPNPLAFFLGSQGAGANFS